MLQRPHADFISATGSEPVTTGQFSVGITAPGPQSRGGCPLLRKTTPTPRAAPARPALPPCSAGDPRSPRWNWSALGRTRDACKGANGLPSRCRAPLDEPARREHDVYRCSGRFSSPGRPAGARGGVAGRSAAWGRASGRAACSGRASGRAAGSGLASGFAADCGRAIGSDFGSSLRTSSGRLSSAAGRFSWTAGRPGSAAGFGSTRAAGAGVARFSSTAGLFS
jgi:hypothetical protein